MTRLAITDHALVRWLDRTGALDMEQLRELLAASLERAAEAAERIGGGEYLILADGLVFIVRAGVVITVVPDDGRHASYLAGHRGKDAGAT